MCPAKWKKLANAVVDLPAFVSTTQVPDSQFVKMDIETVAVWDTVGALGYLVYAHSIPDRSQSEWESLRCHLHAVG